MTSSQPMMDDLARLMGSALAAAGTVRDEASRHLRQRLEDVLASMSLPSREEVDLLKAMLVESRKEQAELRQRLDALEASLKTRKREKTSE